VAGNTYVYFVRGVNAAGGSDRSNLVTVEFRAPPAPSGLSGTAVRIAGNNTQDAVSLAWTDNATFETRYQVQRSTSAAFTNPTTYNLGADVTSFAQNVSRANDYSYRVRAVNGPFNSAWSAAVRVTTP
jgi:predicted phage tail protein